MHASRHQRAGYPSLDVTFLAISRTIVLLGIQTSALAGLLPGLDLAPRSLALGLELVVAGTEFGNGLLGQELL